VGAGRQLSGGRGGLAFSAAGHPPRRARRAGRDRPLPPPGETARLRDGAGTEVDLGIFPLPSRRDLPIWIETGDDPDAFRLAGELGAGVLTDLADLSDLTMEGLAAHLGLYREALARAGHLEEAQAAVRLRAAEGEPAAAAPRLERLREAGV
jgi:alkanesulfonate monooxygenase SsuD/methylene tetrahydromethanopterin reductase-like flavin-dependent oxidoreductase (luciferase family)